MNENHDTARQGDKSPPDRAAAGDVSTTGISSHDQLQSRAHDPSASPSHDSPGSGHSGHPPQDDAPDVSTLVPTTWKQLILPALILLLVGILVAGPLFGAFASRPATPQPAEQNSPPPGQPTTTPAHQGAAPALQTSSTTVQAPTAAIVAIIPIATPNPASLATRTAVALAGERGDVARVPVQLDLRGATFVVKPGSYLLPDWKPSQDVGIATWIQGTVANHILYLPYTSPNASLLQAVKPGDPINLTMNTGQRFAFAVTRSQRAPNGPPASDGQFTVASAMRQDHSGLTLFLIGDPSTDRLVLQADFTDILGFYP